MSDIKNFVIGIITGLISAWLVELIPNPLNFISFNQTVFILPVIFGIVFVIGGRLYQKIKKGDGPLFFAIPEPPQNIISEGVRNKFNVNWKFELGYRNQLPLPFDKPYVYVKGPFCPTCDYELDSIRKPSFFGWMLQKIWHCATCNINYKRPKKYLYDEDTVVRKIIESELKKSGKLK